MLTEYLINLIFWPFFCNFIHIRVLYNYSGNFCFHTWFWTIWHWIGRQWGFQKIYLFLKFLWICFWVPHKCVCWRRLEEGIGSCRAGAASAWYSFFVTFYTLGASPLPLGPMIFFVGVVDESSLSPCPYLHDPPWIKSTWLLSLCLVLNYLLCSLVW